MIIAFILEKKSIWKAVYLFACAISLSRSGLVTFAVLFIFKTLFEKRKLTVKNISRFAMVVGGAIVIAVILYNRSYNIQVTINRIFMRFATIATGEDGTSVHTGYFKRVFRAAFEQLPILQSLFGVGLNTSGIALQYVDTAAGNGAAWTAYTPWGIESDMAGLLTGVGIFGYIYYYSSMAYLFIKHRSIQVKEIAMVLVVFGAMYNISTSTLMQFVLMISYISISYRYNEVNEVGEEKHNYVDIGLYNNCEL